MADNRKLIQIGISGAVALFFVNFYLKARERSIENGFAMVDVLAAARDIPSRTETPASINLTIKRVPRSVMRRTGRDFNQSSGHRVRTREAENYRRRHSRGRQPDRFQFE